MKNFFRTLEIETKKQFEIVDITQLVLKAIADSGIKEGNVTVFCPHTTAAIRLNHNEPLLIQDIMKTLYRVVPIDVSYGHDLFEVRQNVAANERSNGHAHVKSFLLGSSENLIIQKNSLMLGEKQSIFFIELDGGRSRKAHLSILGE